MTYTANRRVETSVRTFEIIEQLAGTGGSRISELAVALDVSKGIIHNHVSTLRELGYVTKVGEEYRLSSKFFQLGHQIRNQSPLYGHGHQELQRISDILGADAIILEKYGDSGVVLTGCYPVGRLQSSFPIGRRIHLANSLPGIAILCSIPRETKGELMSGVDSPLSATLSGYEQQLESDGHVSGQLSPSEDAFGIAVPLQDGANNLLGAAAVHISQTAEVRMLDQAVEAMQRLTQTVATEVSEFPVEHRHYATVKHDWSVHGS